jgi:hypothetical protein
MVDSLTMSSGSKPTSTPLGGGGDGGCHGRVVEDDGDGGGPVNAGRFSFCRHRAPWEWMCNMCQQLHSFCWSGAYEEYAGSERYEKSSCEITNYGQIVRISMTSLRACPIKLFSLRFFMGCVLRISFFEF